MWSEFFILVLLAFVICFAIYFVCVSWSLGCSILLGCACACDEYIAVCANPEEVNGLSGNLDVKLDNLKESLYHDVRKHGQDLLDNCTTVAKGSLVVGATLLGYKCLRKLF